MKLFKYFIDFMFWLWAFIVPAGIFVFAGFLIYIRSSDNLPYAILLTVIGILMGILIAERIRKRHDLTHFFSRIVATPELNNLDKGSNEEIKDFNNKDA